MSITDNLKTLCENLGKNCKPTYVVVAIAAVKGICRPMFTMMDEHEEPKTKKYTAIREGLTEAIAIPVYLVLGELSAKCAKFLPKDLQKRGAKNAMFLGVCASALFVIPGLCSAVIKPIMNTFFKDSPSDTKGNDKKLDIISSSPETVPVHTSEQLSSLSRSPFITIQRPVFNSFSNHSGIKAGGV